MEGSVRAAHVSAQHRARGCPAVSGLPPAPTVALAASRGLIQVYDWGLFPELARTTHRRHQPVADTKSGGSTRFPDGGQWGFWTAGSHPPALRVPARRGLKT